VYLMNVNGLLVPPLPHINRSFCFICSRLYAFVLCTCVWFGTIYNLFGWKNEKNEMVG
jgi:hypothetical protein